VQKPRHNAVERRAAIVDAALPLLGRKGFAGTTTKKLAMAAGVSETLLYKHFPSKRAIYDEILSLGSTRAGTDFNRPARARLSTLALIENIHFLMFWCFDRTSRRRRKVPRRQHGPHAAIDRRPRQLLRLRQQLRDPERLDNARMEIAPL
jgi:AcrR family transcriptional regulator